MVGLKELECVGSTALLLALAHSFPRCARSIEENDLGPEGALALAPALEKMVELKSLLYAAFYFRNPASHLLVRPPFLTLVAVGSG